MHVWQIISCFLTVGVANAQSQPWRDQYIKQPLDFKVTKIARCSYQLTFRRDVVDSRYTLGFETRYGSTRKRVTPVDGGLAVSPDGQNLPPFLYRLDSERDLAVHQLNSVCSRGASGNEPTGFRVLFDLDEQGYTYRNDWWSDVISISSGSVPGVPQNARATKDASGNVTVRWQSVSGASGYFVLINGVYDNSEVGDIRVLWTNIEGAGATSSIIPARRRTQRVAVVARGAAGVVSASGSVPDVRVS